jgi:class 3 adenylate cyclase
MRDPFDDPNIWYLLKEGERIRQMQETYGLDNYTLNRLFWDRQLFNSFSYQDSLLRDDIPQIVREKIANLNIVVDSPFFHASRAANNSALQILETVRPRTELAAQLDHVSNRWNEQLQLARDIVPNATIDMVLKSHLARVADLSIQAQAALANLPPQVIDDAIGIPDEVKRALRDKLLEYSNSYRNLYQSFEQSQTAILSLPPTLSELPAIGYLTGANLVRSISGIPAESSVEGEDVSQEIAEGTAAALEERLAELDARFVQLLRGAEQILESDNPDRIRQFSISLYELVRQVLVQLAPDQEVHAWNNSAEYYDEKGIATDQARIEYICRGTGQEGLNTYTKKSFAFDLELLKYFQHGNNEAGYDYTEDQIRDLASKVENTLLLIIEIALSSNGVKIDQGETVEGVQTNVGDTAASQAERPVEMAHVLFTDVVGYSKLRTDQQPQVIDKLAEIVRSTEEFRRAQANGQMMALPTGDGMALVFFSSPEAPAKCALEISRELRRRPEIKLRMGVHTGPVCRVTDISDKENVAGGGINFAQRVMDCGDAGHILVSKIVADVLGDLSRWENHLHDLGEAEVKHGIRVHIFNLFTDELGNPERPAKMLEAAESLTLTRVIDAKNEVGGGTHQPTAEEKLEPLLSEDDVTETRSQDYTAKATRKPLREPKPLTVRAWVYTVINPLLGKLRREQDYLTKKNWSWEPLGSRLEELTPVLNSANQEQFLRSYPDIQEAINEHNRFVEELRIRCSALHQVIKNSPEFLSLYRKLTAPETIMELRDEFKHKGPRCDTPEGILDEVFGSFGEDTSLGYLAQYMVNNIRDLWEGRYRTAPFWNRYSAQFLKLLEHPPINDSCDKLEETGMALLECTNSLLGLLEETRDFLCWEYDVPPGGEVNHW